MPNTPKPERPLEAVVPAPEQESSIELQEKTEPVVEAPAEQSPESIADQVPASPPVILRDEKIETAPIKSKDRLTLEVEAVLEEDMAELYRSLPPDKQKAFAVKGDETASKIRQLLSETKINVRKIYSLIKDWLKMLPGVNTYFLEQEAKIKADKISLVAEQERREDPNKIT